MVPPEGDFFARGAYTIEVFEDASELEDAEARLISILGAHRPIRIGHNPGISGRA